MASNNNFSESLNDVIILNVSREWHSVDGPETNKQMYDENSRPAFQWETYPPPQWSNFAHNDYYSTPYQWVWVPYNGNFQQNTFQERQDHHYSPNPVTTDYDKVYNPSASFDHSVISKQVNEDDTSAEQSTDANQRKPTYASKDTSKDTDRSHWNPYFGQNWMNQSFDEYCGGIRSHGHVLSEPGKEKQASNSQLTKEDASESCDANTRDFELEVTQYPIQDHFKSKDEKRSFARREKTTLSCKESAKISKRSKVSVTKNKSDITETLYIVSDENSTGSSDSEEDSDYDPRELSFINLRNKKRQYADSRLTVISAFIKHYGAIQECWHRCISRELNVTIAEVQLIINKLQTSHKWFEPYNDVGSLPLVIFTITNLADRIQQEVGLPGLENYVAPTVEEFTTEKIKYGLESLTNLQEKLLLVTLIHLDTRFDFSWDDQLANLINIPQEEIYKHMIKHRPKFTKFAWRSISKDFDPLRLYEQDIYNLRCVITQRIRDRMKFETIGLLKNTVSCVNTSKEATNTFTKEDIRYICKRIFTACPSLEIYWKKELASRLQKNLNNIGHFRYRVLKGSYCNLNKKKISATAKTFAKSFLIEIKSKSPPNSIKIKRKFSKMNMGKYEGPLDDKLIWEVVYAIREELGHDQTVYWLVSIAHYFGKPTWFFKRFVTSLHNVEKAQFKTLTNLHKDLIDSNARSVTVSSTKNEICEKIRSWNNDTGIPDEMINCNTRKRILSLTKEYLKNEKNKIPESKFIKSVAAKYSVKFQYAKQIIEHLKQKLQE